MVRKRNAFTLVELLVVIGIIALLISILLPSLSRARQAANLIDCQSRLRQMGQATQLYVAENNGSLPYAEIYHLDTHILADWGSEAERRASLGHNEVWWKWYFTLSDALGYQTIQSSGWPNAHPIFNDKDTDQEAPWGIKQHYVANQRVFAVITDDPAPSIFGAPASSNIPKDEVRPHTISSIKNASEVMVIWDAPQHMENYGNGAYPTNISMDGWMYYWGHSFYKRLNANNPPSWVNYNRAVMPGAMDGGNADGRAAQKARNADWASWSTWPSHLRFRHMNNTTLAALFLDGHAEIRKVGEVMVNDLCTNFNSHR